VKIFAIADTHLSFAVPGKQMDRFGDNWRDHGHKIAANWTRVVSEGDLVLVGGDTSWAIRWAEARSDLEFLDKLPGKKVLIRGNHDFWWSTLKRVRGQLPASFVALDGDATAIGAVGVCGTRLWEGPGLSFADILPDRVMQDEGSEKNEPAPDDADQNLKIWRREVQRLSRALEHLQRIEQERGLLLKVAMVHYPPCDWRLNENEVTPLFEAAGVKHVVFGHLHGVVAPRGQPLFGERAGVHYHLTASDYLDFTPLLIDEVA
jgi:predicted phosphohydrolase